MAKDDDLKKIKEILEIVAHKVDQIESGRKGQFATIHLMKDQQSVMNEKLNKVNETLDDHTRRLEALSGDTEQVLSELKATHDEIGLWHRRWIYECKVYHQKIVSGLC